MHPLLLGQLARQHVAEMRQAAARRPVTDTPANRRVPLRSRAGWALIKIGLRLAASS